MTLFGTPLSKPDRLGSVLFGFGDSSEQLRDAPFTDGPIDKETRTYKRLERGLCGDCRGKSWYEGPSGGASTNYMCANAACGHWFNISPGGIRFERIKTAEIPEWPVANAGSDPGPAVPELGAPDAVIPPHPVVTDENMPARRARLAAPGEEV